MSTGACNLLPLRSSATWPRATWILVGSFMLWMDTLDGAPRRELESELSALAPIMLYSWPICWSDPQFRSFKTNSMKELTTIYSMLGSSMRASSYLTLSTMLLSVLTSNKERWSSWEHSMPDKWRRVSSLSWTTLCPRRDIFLFTPVAMSELKVTSASSLVCQEQEKQLFQLWATESLLVMMSMSGLIKVSGILKVDVMPNALD